MAKKKAAKAAARKPKKPALQEKAVTPTPTSRPSKKMGISLRMSSLRRSKMSKG